jgi:sporulation protein YlmC with PRC-barrel domain
LRFAAEAAAQRSRPGTWNFAQSGSLVAQLLSSTREVVMTKWTCAALVAGFAMIGTVQLPPNAHAQSVSPQAMTTIPQNSMTVTEWYKQDVYDPQNKKIGSISDVLVDNQGKITALMISVGGKDVAVPFQSVKLQNKNNKSYLVMDSTPDQLKNATGFKYNKNAMTWAPEGTTGQH